MNFKWRAANLAAKFSPRLGACCLAEPVVALDSFLLALIFIIVPLESVPGHVDRSLDSATFRGPPQ